MWAKYLVCLTTNIKKKIKNNLHAELSLLVSRIPLKWAQVKKGKIIPLNFVTALVLYFIRKQRLKN